MKVLFFGTPQIAVPYLEELLNSEEVVGVVTQPDKPKDRGHQLHEPPVKECAKKRGIPVFQAEKFTEEAVDKLKTLNPEVGVVISYGRIIPEKVFKIPVFGCFNIHFSILPKYRGAGPIQWSLINGEKETGITTFWIEKTLDSGPILVQKILSIEDTDDSVTLKRKLIPLGIKAMQETLSFVKQNKCKGEPQKGEPTFAPSLKKEDGRIDWAKSASEIHNLIRGTKPWPGAYTTIKEGNQKGKLIKILKAYLISDSCKNESASIGQIADIVKNKGFVVRCGKGSLLIEEVHLENKKPMPAWAFLQGFRLKAGDIIF
ncbi:MAG: methionyl-tRNA formyltransferase [Endomicrobiales bacterium]|nr:methionyl-tRNA formyltransferase [Endomicrobiales bacterium]